jgi:hypothetical protein
VEETRGEAPVGDGWEKAEAGLRPDPEVLGMRVEQEWFEASFSHGGLL